VSGLPDLLTPQHGDRTDGTVRPSGSGAGRRDGKDGGDEPVNLLRLLGYSRRRHQFVSQPVADQHELVERLSALNGNVRVKGPLPPHPIFPPSTIPLLLQLLRDIPLYLIEVETPRVTAEACRLSRRR